jgi:hypothetical protein
MRIPLQRLLAAALALAMCPVYAALATQPEADVSLTDASPSPSVCVVTPSGHQSYDGADRLTVEVRGSQTELITLELRLADETLYYSAAGTSVTYMFVFAEPQTQAATLLVRGYADAELLTDAPYAEQWINVLSPKADLINKMIALAYANSTSSRYRFAPAQESSDIGICKNFVMRLFDTYSAGYRMRAYPALALHMPKNNSKADCAPYDYGIEWKPETAADGSPFTLVAQFKYDSALTEEENAELARNLLVQVQKGDFLQIVGYYGGGNGPHSLYVIRDYDPLTQMIHWTDSNMRGKRIDGVRWGYLQYDADADVTWWVNVINMKKRGASLYRLRDDLYRTTETE